MPACIRRVSNSTAVVSERCEGSRTTVFLVYARSAPDAPEPLVAVLGTEDEARDLETQVLARVPSARVAWETHVVNGPVSECVHLVSLGGYGDIPPDTDFPEGRDPRVEKLDPTGIAVFADRADAEREASARSKADGVPHYRVRTLPLGWHAPRIP